MADVGEELSRLAALRDKGDITAEEFAAQKAKLLAADVQPKKKRSPLLIGCGSVVVILVVLAIIGSIAGKNDGKTSSGTSAAQGSTAEEVKPVEVTAEQLYRAYKANEARAQKDYGDRPLLVSGTVDGVDLDFVDDPKVKLRTDNQFMSAQASLVTADKPKAADLNKGEKVTLLCQKVTEIISIPMLSECAIQP